MSKELLLKTIGGIRPENYNWTLYFLKMDYRSKPNPYFLYKHTFRNATYLSEYIAALSTAMNRYQIEPLGSVQNYDGENSKTSCDKLSTENELIAEQWSNLVASVNGAPREQIKGKYQGYILDGQPVNSELQPIVVVKACNPIINLEKKYTKVFRHTAENELENITDEICRLYLTADFIVIDRMMYSFNHAFESIFRVQKTMHRIKLRAVETILQTDAFKKPNTVRKYLSGYTSPKTFLTLKPERIAKLSDPTWQAEFANKLKLNVVDGKIDIECQDQANQLIKYLCYKIFQDKETDNLIEVNSVINDNVLHD
jgi:hypothetical protein